MDFGQQRQQNQQNAKSMMYQNTGYDFERRDKKTLIVDVEDTSSTAPLSKVEEFSVDLFEPLTIDKLSDIYLDNFTTYNSLLCDTNDRGAFSLSINEFNINSNVASTSNNQNIFNRIIIPNEHNDISDVNSAVTHKGKKMNYICSINPGRIANITGTVTDLGGGSMFSTSTSAADGGILHYVSLTTGASQHVDKGSLFGWDAGASATTDTLFSVAFDMQEGSTDLYFYSNGGTVDPSTGASLTQISKSTSTTPIATGLNTKIADVSTYKVGDLPRFTAELVIAVRE